MGGGYVLLCCKLHRNRLKVLLLEMEQKRCCQSLSLAIGFHGREMGIFAGAEDEDSCSYSPVLLARHEHFKYIFLKLSTLVPLGQVAG